MSKVGVADASEQEPAKTETVSEESTTANTGFKKRVPKRVLHFCDGTLEEYSSDEEESSDGSVRVQHETQLLQANLASLPWAPWFWHHTVYVGSKALAACDYVGESLANFFGIISPKYEYEIEQYKKMIAEEEKQRKQDVELGVWSENTDSSSPIQSEPGRLSCPEYCPDVKTGLI